MKQPHWFSTYEEIKDGVHSVYCMVFNADGFCYWNETNNNYSWILNTVHYHGKVLSFWPAELNSVHSFKYMNQNSQELNRRCPIEDVKVIMTIKSDVYLSIRDRYSWYCTLLLPYYICTVQKKYYYISREPQCNQTYLTKYCQAVFQLIMKLSKRYVCKPRLTLQT